MKSLDFNQLQEFSGGDAGTTCGVGVALLVIFPSPWTLIGAAALCLTGDTAR